VINREGLLGNPLALAAAAVLILLQLLLTYLPFMQSLFGTAGLDLDAWLRIIFFGLGLFLIIELEKMLIARRR